ncbi:MAG: hypothetical protein IJU48_00035 [Synergistaceae bacterium]|nr:hypothetical protein [Synergistaceae bacterium]
MEKLLTGELNLTIDILIGLLIGEIIIKLKLPDKILKIFMPFLKRHNIPPVSGLALAVSAGSSKAGAAIISSALANNEISQNCALWSVQLLHFPAYLRRWPSTFALSVSMAGSAGFFFGISLIFSSFIRFIIAFMMLKRERLNSKPDEKNYELGQSKHSIKFVKKLIKTLPLAWIFYALAFSIVPGLNKFFQSIFAGHNTLLPLAGWTIAAASIAHVSSALALTGGSLASGELTISQAVFALILGNCLGSATRILRMNAGYYFGLFEARIAQKMLVMNFITIMIPSIINLIFAFSALLFSS